MKNLSAFAASATPPLRVIAEILRDNLDLKGSVPQVVNAAAEVLGLVVMPGVMVGDRVLWCREKCKDLGIYV